MNRTPGRVLATGTGASGTTYRLRFHEGTSGAMGLYIGRGNNSECVGEVSDRANFEYAVDVADEEVRVLLAEVRRELHALASRGARA